MYVFYDFAHKFLKISKLENKIPTEIPFSIQ